VENTEAAHAVGRVAEVGGARAVLRPALLVLQVTHSWFRV